MENVCRNHIYNSYNLVISASVNKFVPTRVFVSVVCKLARPMI